MAIGWMTVLKMVPWTDVIKNAPAVADGAKKLWKTVAKDNPAHAAQAPDAAVDVATLPATQALVALQAQLNELQQDMADLHAQMRESSGLITALAEQNTQLIKRVEVNRRRVWALVAAVLVLALVGVAQWSGA